MRLSFLIRLLSGPLRRDERGMVLATTLVVMVLLMGVSSTALFASYTNLLMATNLKLATRARATAESAINEALYRLSRQEGKPGTIVVPDLNDPTHVPNAGDPDWQVNILPTDDAGSSAEVATIQISSDWPHSADTPPVTLQYKKDETGKVIFYDPTQTPKLFALALPASPAAIPDTANPVIQITATGLDKRQAKRVILAEVARTVAFPPPAPLASGVDVNLNGSGFIDGVNHDHRISLDPNGIYGDNGNSETTEANSPIKDGPDDNRNDSGQHDKANPGLDLTYPSPALPYSSYSRLFNQQLSASDPTPAWVGLTKVGNDKWSGVNQGYTSAIALSSQPTVIKDQQPNNAVWTRGLFSWRVNNKDTSLTTTMPPPNTTSNCSPAGVPTLVCRPVSLTAFPTFQQYLGLDDLSFQNLLDSPDTTRADLDVGKPPLGFTYIQGNYTFNNSTASPATNDFGLLYVTGSLTINGNQTFKGLIFVDGSLSVSGNPTVLGAVMVRGTTQITAGTGNMTLLYSRKAAELGLQNAHAWRIVSWEDTAMQ